MHVTQNLYYSVQIKRHFFGTRISLLDTLILLPHMMAFPAGDPAYGVQLGLA